MSEERERCDHCGKWQIYSELVMPHTSEEYWDGSFAVCTTCVKNKKYTVEYWDNWYLTKSKELEKEDQETN